MSRCGSGIRHLHFLGDRHRGTDYILPPMNFTGDLGSPNGESTPCELVFEIRHLWARIAPAPMPDCFKKIFNPGRGGPPACCLRQSVEVRLSTARRASARVRVPVGAKSRNAIVPRIRDYRSPPTVALRRICIERSFSNHGFQKDSAAASPPRDVVGGAARKLRWTRRLGRTIMTSRP